jgi:hypothetical protein
VLRGNHKDQNTVGTSPRLSDLKMIRQGLSDHPSEVPQHLNALLQVNLSKAGHLLFDPKPITLIMPCLDIPGDDDSESICIS